MALTELTKSQVYADHGMGYTQEQLAKKYKLSKTTVNTIINSFNLRFPEVAQDLLNLNQKVIDLQKKDVKKTGIKSADLVDISEIVDRKLRDTEFFRNASIRIIEKTLLKLESPHNIADLLKAQEIVSIGRETIYGKSPEIAVQVNNNTNLEPSTKADLSLLTLEEKINLRKKVLGISDTSEVVEVSEITNPESSESV